MGGGTKPNFNDWKNVATLKAWELAALMRETDPRALSDAMEMVINEFGQRDDMPLALSWHIRLITGALQAKLICSPYPLADEPGSETTVTVSSLGEWLVNQGHEALALSLGLNVPPSVTPQATSNLDQPIPLATRSELISAFGAFTGLSDEWFKNLKDKPALQRARKVEGIGQRGQTKEPLFCPYEVMLWLINPKRRTGRPLTEDKGWELFEKNFSTAYNRNSVADPRG